MTVKGKGGACVHPMFQRICMFLRMRRHLRQPLPDPRTQIAIIASPTLRVDLNEGLDRIGHPREISLRVRYVPIRIRSRVIPECTAEEGRGQDRGHRSSFDVRVRNGVRVGVGANRGGARARGEGGQREVSREDRASEHRSEPYRSCLSSPDDALSKDADLLPVLDKRAHFLAYDPVTYTTRHTFARS